MTSHEASPVKTRINIERFGLHTEHTVQHIEDILAIEDTQERLGQLMMDVISYRTVDDGQHFDEMYGLMSYVNLYLERVSKRTGQHFNQEIFLGPENSLSLMVGINDNPENKTPEQLHDELFHPKATMLVHGDVVDAPDEESFVPKIEGNMIIGRGARDMKNALVLFLDLLRNKKIPHGITLTLTTDEETGGNNGTGYLKSIGFNPKSLVIFDGQKPDTLSFGGKAKGELIVDLDTSFFKNNVYITLMWPFHQLVEQHYPTPQRTDTDLTETTTISVTQIIPEKVQFLSHVSATPIKVTLRFDCRSGQNGAIEQSQIKLTQAMKEFIQTNMHIAEENITIVTDGTKHNIQVRRSQKDDWVTVCALGLPLVTSVYKIDDKSQHVRLFKSVYKKIFKRSVKTISRDTGLNDGRFFVNEDGNAIPTILFLVAGSDRKTHGAHEKRERANLAYMVRIEEVLAEYFEGILNFDERRKVA